MCSSDLDQPVIRSLCSWIPVLPVFPRCTASPLRIDNCEAAHCKLKMDLLAFFAPSLARKAHRVTRKRVNTCMKRLLQRVAGIDGCKSGWLIVEATIDLGVQDWKIVPEWNTIDSKADVLAVDMPIGLSVSGVRQCDVDARRVISPCGSRVFKAPPREALRFAQSEWATANQWSKRNKFGGLSRQIWNIRPRIKIGRAHV